MRRRPGRINAASVLGVVSVTLSLTVGLTACTGSPTASDRPSAVTPVPSSAAASTPAATAGSQSVAASQPVTPSPPAATAQPTAQPTDPSQPTPAAPSVPAGTGPVIVIDPGHSPTITSVDADTGLNDSDYANQPEMRDVFEVAQLVKGQLQARGYRVVLTKNSVNDRVSLGQRARIANDAHAALALSIHDQAGANGGIGFNSGNNTVYFQSVGDYRSTPTGARISFDNSQLAATSARYGSVFQARRAAAEGHLVRVTGSVGYDLGSRGLAAGNIWMVQLLASVPWIYNEAGGNSAGMVGLSAADKQQYANGLVAGVVGCVPVTSG